MMRLVFLCMAVMLLVSGCATSEKIAMEAQKTVAEQVDPQISKLKSQFAMIDMNYSQLEQQLAGLKDDLTAAKADLIAQNAELKAQREGYAGTVSDIKAIVEKAVLALDAKISQVEAGMSKMKADIAAAASAAQAPAAAPATAPAPEM